MCLEKGSEMRSRGEGFSSLSEEHNEKQGPGPQQMAVIINKHILKYCAVLDNGDCNCTKNRGM